MLFVVDARAGATALDHDLAGRCCAVAASSFLLLVANKLDSREHVKARAARALRVGSWARPLPRSRPSTAGAWRRTAPAVDGARSSGDRQTATRRPRTTRQRAIARRGPRRPRPNVGKSSILNRLVGEERVLVSERARARPGTAVDTLLEIGRAALPADRHGRASAAPAACVPGRRTRRRYSGPADNIEQLRRGCAQCHRCHRAELAAQDVTHRRLRSSRPIARWWSRSTSGISSSSSASNPSRIVAGPGCGTPAALRQPDVPLVLRQRADRPARDEGCWSWPSRFTERRDHRRVPTVGTEPLAAGARRRGGLRGHRCPAVR